eukprot:1855975-Pleurochrysis_carterae.AAC.3
MAMSLCELVCGRNSAALQHAEHVTCVCNRKTRRILHWGIKFVGRIDVNDFLHTGHMMAREVKGVSIEQKLKRGTDIRMNDK